MRRVKSILSVIVIAGAVALPASAVGDATNSLATYRSMAAPAVSPSDRIMAVYIASAERFEMLRRLREKYPALVW